MKAIQHFDSHRSSVLGQVLELAVFLSFACVALTPGLVSADDRDVATPPVAAPIDPPMMPILFVENCGQIESPATYVVRTPSLDAYFIADGIVLSLASSDPRFESHGTPNSSPSSRTSLRMTPLGTRAGVEPSAERRTEAVVNVYRGAERYEGIATYSSVAYRELYPGIDLVYSGNGASLKADWIVAPAVSVDRIHWRYDGAESLEVRADGALVIGTSLGRLIEAAPVIYQDTAEGRRSVEGGFRLLDNDELGFWIGAYDGSLPLVIDPDLEWSTFLGGSGSDQAEDIVVDGSGNVYVGGITESQDFPTTPGAFDTTLDNGAFQDGFVTKLDANGSLVWSTYIGGSARENLRRLAVDAGGNVVFSLDTSSADFPVTPGAFDTQLDGWNDIVVGKLDSTGGALVFATFLGGSDASSPFGDVPMDLGLDAAGNVFVVGMTWSNDYPTTPSAFDTVYTGDGEGFVTKLSASGDSLIYSTFLGGTEYAEAVHAIALDTAGRATVTGFSGVDFPTTPGAYDRTSGGLFVAQLDSTGSSLVYSTFVSSYGNSYDIVLDDAGRPCLTGVAWDVRYPVTPGAFAETHGGMTDAFLTQLDATGSSLVFSTFLGGNDHDQIDRLARDPVTGNWLLAGISSSTNFPTTPGAYNPLAFENGWYNGVYTLLDSTGSRLIYSTALGGGNRDWIKGAAFDASGTVHLAGYTFSPNFPITPGAFDSTFGGSIEGFVVKMRPGPVLRFQGTPSVGQSVFYEIDWAATSETGNTALVFLSTSGTQGVPMPGGEVLPLTFDAATALGLQITSLLITTIDAAGHAVTPVASFPAAPVGLTVYSAAATWNLGSAPKVLSVTPPIQFVTQ